MTERTPGDAGARAGLGGGNGPAPGALLVIISGPSGVGKDTIIDALRQRPHERDYHYVVTCTTRARRPGEVDGVDYQFLSRETFDAWRAAGELLEANEVHGNWYGTPRRQLREALAAGKDVILKIDVQGAQVVKEKIPDALLIFLVPPSLEDLFH
ncbi:MAG TPA: guanylate kinase, partial [Vitreimonas sp.]|nr:guanylate kinase [Vitreimonas sp.]